MQTSRSRSGMPANPVVSTIAVDNGAVGTPSIKFTNSLTTGFFRQAADVIGVATAGVERIRFGSAGAIWTTYLAALNDIGFSTVIGGATDVILNRDAAATLAQRNSTNAQTFRVYNTYTDASNFNRLSLISSNASDATSGTIAMEILGTGTTTGLRVQGKYNVSGTSQIFMGGTGDITFGQYLVRTAWTVQGSSGHFLAGTDNTYDIGANGATRPRNVFIASGLNVAGSGGIGTNIVNLGAGIAGTSSERLKIAAGTTAIAQVTWDSGVAPTTPANGNMWFDGTDMKIRIGGVTKTFTVT
jgi:hypothetical protein